MARTNDAHILLVETASGDVVGVRFPTSEAARDWEDAHETDFTVRGNVLLVSKTEALRMAKGDA